MRLRAAALAVAAACLAAPSGSPTRITVTPAERTIDALTRQIQLLPVFRDGRLHAYVVQSVEPGSWLSRIGLRANDRIVRANGRAIGDRFPAADLLELFQHARKLSLELETPDGPHRLDVELSELGSA